MKPKHPLTLVCWPRLPLYTWLLLLPGLPLSSCTKQLVTDTVPAAEKNEAPATRSRLSTPLSKLISTGYDAYPAGGMGGPIIGPAIFDMYSNNNLLGEHVEIANDNQKLYVSVVNANWQATTGNLNLWIGRTTDRLPLGNGKTPNTTKLPVKYTVAPGTSCFTIEIDLYDLATYLGLPAQPDRAGACDLAFQLLVQADVSLAGRNRKAWAGDVRGGAGVNTYRYVSNYRVQCTGMPNNP